MSAIRVDQNILNQRGTPAFFADDFSRRPAAGYQGRIFISADTHEIYRDDTTAWVLIADAGAGSGTLQSVTANGHTTSYGIDILGVGLRVQAGGITDYTIPSGGIMFGSPSYLLTTDTTNLFWDDTNNRLGLGTNTPGARLDVHATGTNATFNGTGTSNSTLVFQRSGTSRWTIGNYYSSAVADDFNIYDNVNSQYRFYVHNTGVINIPTSLIIGSSTPTSSYILDVTGNSNITGTFRTTGNATFLTNVGIGSSAAYKLDVRGTYDASGIITVRSTDSATIDVGGVLGFGGFHNGSSNESQWAWIKGAKENSSVNNNASYLSFATMVSGGSPTEKLRISSGGAVTITNLGTGAVTATGGVLSTTSDMNLKIEDGFIDNALEKILKLTPRYFYWKEESNLPTDLRQLGFYAQEVNEALGEEVANTPKEENQNWGIYDRGIIAMLTKAFQELNEKLVRNNIN